MLKTFANKHAAILTAALLMSGFAALPVCAGQTNAAQNADDKEIAMLKQRVDEQERMINDLLRFNSPAKFHHHMRRMLNDPYFAPDDILFNAPMQAPTDVFGRMNVSDKKDAIEVTVEMPGMDKKDIEIEVKDNILTISGEKKEAQEVKEGDYYMQERQFGQSNRSIGLPDNIDVNKISSSLKNGVLTIIVPKTVEKAVEVKKIPVD